MKAESGTGIVAIIAIVILVIGALFFLGPKLAGKTGTTVNIPSSVDLNVK